MWVPLLLLLPLKYISWTGLLCTLRSAQRVGGAAVVALDLAWPRALDAASIEALALAFMPPRDRPADDAAMPVAKATKASTKATSSIPQPMLACNTNGASQVSEFSLYACVCYCHRLQHYVAYVRRNSDRDRFLFFNDLPNVLQPRARRSAKSGPPTKPALSSRDAVTWADAAPPTRDPRQRQTKLELEMGTLSLSLSSWEESG